MGFKQEITVPKQWFLLHIMQSDLKQQERSVSKQWFFCMLYQGLLKQPE
jgi:hypothetical protein